MTVLFVEYQVTPTIVEYSAIVSIADDALAQQARIESPSQSSIDPSNQDGYDAIDTVPLITQESTSRKPFLTSANIIENSKARYLYCQAKQQISSVFTIFKLHIFYGVFILIMSLLAAVLQKFWLMFFTTLCSCHLAALLQLAVKEETIAIIRHVGIQIRTTYFLGHQSSQFIDKDKVKGVFIHEYIERSSVRTGLAFIIDGEPKLKLVFRHCYPGFQAIQTVYRACLAES